MKSKPMTLQLQPNKWSCLVTAFAMALDINVNDLIKSLGHDGSEIKFPELGERGRRGHHTQEIVDLCIKNGIKVVLIEAAPLGRHVGVEDQFYLTNDEMNFRMAYYLEHYYGVLCGMCSDTVAHAVAWNGESIYNPSGIVESSFEHLQIMSFFIVGKL